MSDLIESVSVRIAHLKTAGLPAELLTGSGDVAACVRIAHGLRLGMADIIVKA